MAAAKKSKATRLPALTPDDWAILRERLAEPELAAELVRLKPDVLVTHGPPGALAAKRATDTIPIVVGVIGEAVAIGAVDTLARPGGNVTAQAFFVAELNAKRLEVLKEAFPRVGRVGVLLKRDNPANGPVLRTMEHTAQALKIQLHPLEVLTPADLDSAVADFVKGDADAIAVHEEAMLIAQAERIADLARKYRLPTIGFVEYARAGGLLALGVDFPDLWRRAAGTVDRILKGAKPADIPIEQATKFELMVNMKTARSLGLTIPATGAVSGTSSHRVTNFTPTPAQRVVPLHRTSFTILSLVGRAQPIRSEMQCSSEDFRDHCGGYREPPQAELERFIDSITCEQEKSIAKVRSIKSRLFAVPLLNHRIASSVESPIPKLYEPVLIGFAPQAFRLRGFESVLLGSAARSSAAW
jgi:putative ABC transport system substrate-binding protein